MGRINGLWKGSNRRKRRGRRVESGKLRPGLEKQAAEFGVDGDGFEAGEEAVAHEAGFATEDLVFVEIDGDVVQGD